VSTTVTYREAALADEQAIFALRLSVRENVLRDPSRVTHADYVAYVSEIGKGWVAERAGEIIGFAFANRSGLIWALFLRPGCEGQGIGKQLLQRCTAWLRAIGVREAFLDTGAGTRAEEFYRRQGWTEVARDELKVDFRLRL
jgi:N-acetylglutamate synthase-like GNAT family acetyltransferase